MITIALNTAHPDTLRIASKRSTAMIGRVAAPFQPLDADIVSEAIPAFFIGRNNDGFWVARDVKGKTGGIFLFERSALSFARVHSQPQGGATIQVAEGFELDLKNEGNPFLARLGWSMRLATFVRRRTAALMAITRSWRPYAVAAVTAGAVLTGLMALRTAIYLWRFHY